MSYEQKNLRVFLCWWNPDSYEKEHKLVHHTVDFFTEENGYSGEEIAEIYNLGLHESFMFHSGSPYPDHIIIRVT